MRDINFSKRLRLALLPALAASVSLSAAAQTAAPGKTANPGASANSATPGTAYRALRASALIGKEVRNPQGTNIGKINDLIVDMTTGDVRYAMLEFDPGIFQGERLFAVPTSELRMAADRDGLVYNMTRDKLERSAVNRADWNRTWSDPSYLANLDKTWGVVQPSRGARAHRVSDLLGKDVNNRQGSKIGEIEELMIDMAARKVHYALLEFDPSWAAPEKFYAFPLRAFNLAAGRDDLVLDVDKSKIQAMKAFPAERFGTVNDPAWVADVDRYFVTVLPTLVVARTGPSGQALAQSSESRAPTPGTARAPRADRN